MPLDDQLYAGATDGNEAGYRYQNDKSRSSHYSNARSSQVNMNPFSPERNNTLPNISPGGKVGTPFQDQ